jgi:hypothetical protein
LPPGSPFSFFFSPANRSFSLTGALGPLSFTNAGGSHIFSNLRATSFCSRTRGATLQPACSSFFFFFFHSLISLLAPPTPRLCHIAFVIPRVVPSSRVASPLTRHVAFVTRRVVVSPHRLGSPQGLWFVFSFLFLFHSLTGSFSLIHIPSCSRLRHASTPRHASPLATRRLSPRVAS